MLQEPTVVTTNTGFKSKKTLQNQTSMARKVLPHSPVKFAGVVSNLIQQSTPRKRKALSNILDVADTKRTKLEDAEGELAKEILNEVKKEKAAKIAIMNSIRSKLVKNSLVRLRSASGISVRT